MCYVDIRLSIFQLCNNVEIYLTNGCVNNSSSLDSMPSLLDADVTDEAEEEGGDPHSNVRQGSKGAGSSNVELQNIVGVFRKICHHCVVTPVVANLGNRKQINH